MTAAELLAHLLEYTEEESLYRQYAEAKCDQATLTAFINKMNPTYLSSHKFIMPELRDVLDLQFNNEAWMWDQPNMDIYIHKHPRYMPAWDFVHEFYEVMYSFSGQFTMYAADQEIHMEPGCVCLIPPGVHHHVSIFDDTICFNIKIRKSTFQSSFSTILSGSDVLARFFLNTIYLGDYQDYVLYRTPDDGVVRQLISHLYMEQLKNIKFSDRIMNQLLCLCFLHLMQQYDAVAETAPQGKDQRQKTELILSYIEKNFRTVTLHGMASEFYFSEQYLSKYIKQNTGRTFLEILSDIRLSKACKLLETTELSVSNISDASGYTSMEHFTRVFKKRYGVSPTAYRANHIVS